MASGGLGGMDGIGHPAFAGLPKPPPSPESAGGPRWGWDRGLPARLLRCPYPRRGPRGIGGLRRQRTPCTCRASVTTTPRDHGTLAGGRVPRQPPKRAEAPVFSLARTHTSGLCHGGAGAMAGSAKGPATAERSARGGAASSQDASTSAASEPSDSEPSESEPSASEPSASGPSASSAQAR